MITVSIGDPDFNTAYTKAHRALPVETLESPRQYFTRWRETYNCRVLGHVVVFDRDSDYTAFMLRWS